MTRPRSAAELFCALIKDRRTEQLRDEVSGRRTQAPDLTPRRPEPAGDRDNPGAAALSPADEFNLTGGLVF